MPADATAHALPVLRGVDSCALECLVSEPAVSALSTFWWANVTPVILIVVLHTRTAILVRLEGDLCLAAGCLAREGLPRGSVNPLHDVQRSHSGTQRCIGKGIT